jgi:hypothetical protein
MYKLKNSVFALVGLLALVGTISVLTPRSGFGQKAGAQPSTIPPPLNVNVVNTPLPVTGTISVGNLGDSPLPVRDVDNPARQPVQFKLGATDSYTVPNGKRLVIEYVSAEIFSFSSCTLTVARLKTTAGGVEQEHQFYLQLVGTNVTNRYYAANQQTRLYADPNTEVVPGSALVCSGFNQIQSTVISGYLVDLP